MFTKASTAVAPTVGAAAPTAGVLPSRRGQSHRPSHGIDSSPRCCPSPDPNRHLGTSDGDTWVQETAPPRRCPRPMRNRTRLGHYPPARLCTREATVLLALRYSCV